MVDVAASVAANGESAAERAVVRVNWADVLPALALRQPERDRSSTSLEHIAHELTALVVKRAVLLLEAPVRFSEPASRSDRRCGEGIRCFLSPRGCLPMPRAGLRDWEAAEGAHGTEMERRRNR